MIAKWKSCRLEGIIDAPPSKSMAHRYLIGAALTKEVSKISGIDYSEDILASIECLKSLGARVETDKDVVTIDATHFMEVEDSTVLECRESGSTLRFFIPLALCLNKKVTLTGTTRLFERPLDVYENLCEECGFEFHKETNAVTLCGELTSGNYKIQGDISSQFITGLIFALVYLGGNSKIQITPPFESRSYVNMTIAALKSFGGDVEFVNEFEIVVRPAILKSVSGIIEGDYSNAAFLEAFNCVGANVKVENLETDSLQGDSVYRDYFEALLKGTPTLDISNCPDLGPVLFAVAALNHGATFTGTARLKAKESDRGQAMKEELQKLGGDLIIEENKIIVPKQELKNTGTVINGHNDHRIVMAMSVILSKIGGTIEGIEAVRKSYPGFFLDIKKLGAEVEIA